MKGIRMADACVLSTTSRKSFQRATLDVGCGDGQVANLIMQRRPDVGSRNRCSDSTSYKDPVAESDGQQFLTICGFRRRHVQ